MFKNKAKICFIPVLSIFGLISTITSCNDDRLVPPDDDTVDGHFDMWNDEQKTLMEKYCGEVLPYATEMFIGNVTVQEVYDSDYDYSYLEIYDEATSFTLADYFYDYLQKFGWNTIRTYGGDVVQTDTSNTQFVELTKASTNSEIGYDLVYFFNDDEDAPANVIKCYNDLTSKDTDATSWSENEEEIIKEVTTISLPFLQFGDGYNVSKLNYNALQIYDAYTEDLTKEYANLLIKAGFSINKEYTQQYDAYVLTKKLDDGSYIDILLTYFNGNTFSVYYTAKQNKYSYWPTEIIDEIKEKTGTTIPQFEIAEGGYYYAYKKNDSYFIYTYNLKDSYNYETYALNVIKHIGLTWNETINFTSYNLTDSDSNVIGYQLVAEVSEPTSTFSTSYPETKISDTISNLLNIKSVTLPSFDTTSIPASSYQVKYQIRGEDIYNSQYEYYYTEILDRPTYFGLTDDATIEEIKALAKSLAYQEEGIIIDIYDINSQACLSYENILYNLGWYRYLNEYGFVIYEDPTGTLAVTFDTYQNPSWDGVGKTEIFIHPGTGNTHTPEFSFAKEEYDVAIGQTKLIEVNKNMLPYEVNYSIKENKEGFSVDKDGNVTIADTVTKDTTATLIATLTDSNGKTYTSECTIKATDEIVYDAVEAIDSLGSLIKSKGYEASIEHPVWSETYRFDNLTVDLGSLTIDEAKELIKNNFILKGFVLDEDFSDTIITISNEEYSAQVIKYKTSSTEYFSVELEYNLYTVNGKTMLYVESY